MKVELGQRGLDAIPDDVWAREGVTELFVHGNRLTSLDPRVGSLRALRVLDLSDNPEMGALPASIGALDRLEFLYAARLGLERVPVELGALSSLRYLQLGGNAIARLDPDAIGRLHALEELRIEGNPIAQLTGLAGLGALRELHARGCGLMHLTPVLCELPELRVLDVRANNLYELPAWLDDAPRLHKIDARWNPMTTPPAADWIARLRARGCVVYT